MNFEFKSEGLWYLMLYLILQAVFYSGFVYLISRVNPVSVSMSIFFGIAVSIAKLIKEMNFNFDFRFK